MPRQEGSEVTQKGQSIAFPALLSRAWGIEKVLSFITKSLAVHTEVPRGTQEPAHLPHQNRSNQSFLETVKQVACDPPHPGSHVLLSLKIHIWLFTCVIYTFGLVCQTVGEQGEL